MGHEIFSDVLQPLAVFGGIALVILASARAKLEHRKLEIQQWRQTAQTPVVQPQTASQDAVLAELKALREQVTQMQDTGHQFDIAFDAALSRLEGRVERLETKTSALPAATGEEATQRVGLR